MSGCLQRFEIGGPVRRSALPALAAAINESLDGDYATVETLAAPDTGVDESTENDLRLGLDCDDPDDWVFVVEFYGSPCRYGMFQPLIDACIAARATFDLYVERDEETGAPYVVSWRVGMAKPIDAWTTGYCGEQVAVATRAAIDAVWGNTRRSLDLLRALRDATTSAMGPYVVVDDEVKSDG